MPISKASSSAVAPGAKGDLVVGNATNDSGILAVGSANQVLTVDSSTATGLKWATAASGLPANGSAEVTTSESTTSTAYTNLATNGPAVTLTTGTKALVIVTGDVTAGGSSSSGFMSFAISGATTLSANDKNAFRWYMINNSAYGRASAGFIITGLTAGSNTFTARYKSEDGSTWTFRNRQISVVDMGS